jgi:hypothetical protein
VRQAGMNVDEEAYHHLSDEVSSLYRLTNLESCVVWEWFKARRLLRANKPNGITAQLHSQECEDQGKLSTHTR